MAASSTGCISLGPRPILSDSSEDALMTIDNFRQCMPVFYEQCYPIVDPILRFLIDDFKFYVDPAKFSWYADATPECRILRDTIIFTIMKELRFGGKYTVDFDEDWDHDIFCLVFSWYLNEPSMERVRQHKNKYQEAESFTDGESCSPRKVQHCHDRTYVQFPLRKNTRFEVPFSPGSFYGEINKRKSFISKKMKHRSRGSGGGRLDSEYEKQSLERVRNSQKLFSLLLSDIPRMKKIPAQVILSHVLLETKSRHKERYSWFFEEHSMEEIERMIFGAFTPGMKAIMELDSIGYKELTEISGEPDKDKDAGVYLHILSTAQMPLDEIKDAKVANMPKDMNLTEDQGRPKTERTFWLYVGQSFELQDRIEDHNDLRYRRKHPSLHYHVWESIEDVKSIFVKIATVQGEKNNFKAFFLNILEMFTCCIFQTLRPHDVENYLPEDVPKPWAGRHLNVALPLWQGFSDDVSPEVLVTRKVISRILV